jgi:hypothetical protein
MRGAAVEMWMMLASWCVVGVDVGAAQTRAIGSMAHAEGYQGVVGVSQCLDSETRLVVLKP